MGERSARQRMAWWRVARHVAMRNRTEGAWEMKSCDSLWLRTLRSSGEWLLLMKWLVSFVASHLQRMVLL
ncbi:hypothetical protein NDU88_004402 [Pleurodeles waltl]|uniref:Uncharacterized protein n=1 Tax=Pleurodeles waltl TaxID=8319 RepID=A0AAV7SIS7_PLEWA|nr:hypothetical protein NDU88_004402 [Pleurodeles waltl]